MVIQTSYAPSFHSLGSGCLEEDDDKVLEFNPSFEEAKNKSLHQKSEDRVIGGTFEPNDSWNEACVQQTAILWELSAKEQSNLIDLGQRLQDIVYYKNTPAEVVRFLLARPGDVDAAETMFRTMVAWRMKAKMDTILQDYHPPKELNDCYPGAILQGQDKEGDPVFLARAGVTDGAAMLRRFGRHDMIQHAIWTRELACYGEWVQDYEKSHHRPVKRMTVIEDAYGLPLLKTMANRELLTVFGEVMRLQQENYPETAKKLIVIRAPALFAILWNILQHFFDPRVRSKIVICGITDYKQVLSEYLDLEILPDCIVPGIGNGKAVEGMPSNFEGGPLPAARAT
jgi:CRAL/TRIO domain